MTRFTVALTAAVLVVGALPSSAEAARQGREVVPTFQAVELEVDADQKDYRGSVRIALNVEQPTDHFRLHAREMEMESVTLEGPEGAIGVRHEKEGDDVVLFRVDAPLEKGEHTLTIIFAGPFNTRAVALYRILTQTESGGDRAFRRMTENYATLAERLPPELMGFMPFFAGGCSAERLESARAFFAEPAHQANGTPRMIARVSAQVDECLALRAREGDAARRFLEGAGS